MGEGLPARIETVNTPLDFLRLLIRALSDAGVGAVVTSGMACVHYGLQQTTKDVDVVVPLHDLTRLHDLIPRLEQGLPAWRIGYRVIFGAPLAPEFMEHGWSSHLALWPDPASPEQHLDVFCRPPRVHELSTDPDAPAFASRHVVAQMKRTDRARDWPIVDGLGLQLRQLSPPLALLHVQDPTRLRGVWESVPAEVRAEAAARRPLLHLLQEVADDDALEAWLRLERLVWETTNQERYRLFEAAWKEFYRRWRQSDAFDWPSAEPWRAQHERVLDAARSFGLARDPLGAAGRDVVYERAVRRAAVRGGTTEAQVARVRPPREEVLP